MASLGAMVAGGIFNAVAFAGAGTCFKNLTKMDTVRRQKDTISLWKNLIEHNKNGIRKT